MLKFAEKTLKAVRDLRRQTEEKLLSNSISSMEQYKYLHGRLDAYNFVEQEIRSLLGPESEELG